MSFVEHIVAARANDALGAVERGVLGVTDPEQIAAVYESWCRTTLSSGIRDAWMFAVSVGCVAGLDLEDGRRVVVKAYPPDRGERRLDAMLAIQRRAAARGLPAPVPLGGPALIGRGWAVVETALVVGRHPDLMRAPDRETAAVGWVRIVQALRDSVDLVRDEHPSPRVMDGLYPLPHSPVFDFEATGAGAEWIDSLARSAMSIIDRVDAPRVLVHSDWRGDNIRVSDDGTELVAIYDWESVGLQREAVALGEVAAMHSIDWSSGDPYFATGAECLEFARAVERARSSPFTPSEWNAVVAAVVYGWCYTARCEHAWTFVGPDKPQFRMRERLRAEGEMLLAAARDER